MSEPLSEMFEEQRGFLLNLATKIVGIRGEAEDIVEETFLRWQNAAPENVEFPRAYLARILSRLCINHLRSARVRREVPLDDLETVNALDFGGESLESLGDALCEAFHLVLRTLSANERVVFILREVFEFDYDEIATVVKSSPENCRQILRRARERLHAPRPRFTPVRSAADQALTAFLGACRSGELEPLLSILSEDVLLLQDGGNLAAPAPPALRGRATVGSKLHAILQRIGAGSRFEPRPLGTTCWLLCPTSEKESGGAPYFIAEFAGESIRTLSILSCPARKRRVRVIATLKALHPPSARVPDFSESALNFAMGMDRKSIALGLAGAALTTEASGLA
jgi:RNA polymerase sigma-70 factor (ECF subfamily)